MQLCECEATVQNTGTPSCKTLMRDAEMVILVPKYGSDGSLNRIDLTDTLDQTYFDNKVNAVDSLGAAVDPLDRWYPLPRLKNPTSERGDNVYQEYDDATRNFVHQGVRPYTFLLPNQEPAYLKKLESFACQEFGFFIVDKNKALIGMGDDPLYLRPIWVDQDTFVATYGFPSATTVPTITVTFNFHIDEQDGDLKQINASEISPVNLLNLKGLLDVYATYSAISTTGATMKLYTKFGSSLNPKVVPGLLTTDFYDAIGGTADNVYNTTDSLAVAIATFAENPDGTYALTWAAQTSADKIRVTPVKAGFDFTEVTASLITIP